MDFPVVFQTLEQELGDSIGLLHGKVLNAGCGDRDLSFFLSKQKAVELVNVDIDSKIPGAVIADLRELPFERNTFDAVLCNAVLEHHPEPTHAVREMVRVLKPGGHIILCVPFLQPYHPCPGDYTRYTATGLMALGKDAGLSVLMVREVHTLVHTIAWILWDYIVQRELRAFKLIFYWSIYLLTKAASTIPPKQIDPNAPRTANTFQIIFLK